jgi:hypothetical protein
MHIFSRDVFKKLVNHEKGWEDALPEGIADIIKEKNLFIPNIEKKSEEKV